MVTKSRQTDGRTDQNATVTRFAYNFFYLIQQEITDTGSKAKLQDFNVKANTSILLLVVLYNIPERLNDVTFDITWGLAPNDCDYIDSNCFVFSGTRVLMNVAWQSSLRNYANGAITHSGDLFDYNDGRPGHQIIKAKMHNIPSNVTHLFFVLSSYSGPTLQHFPNQTLRFFDNATPSKDLCKTTFQTRATLASSGDLFRHSSGKWLANLQLRKTFCWKFKIAQCTKNWSYTQEPRLNKVFELAHVIHGYKYIYIYILIIWLTVHHK